MKKLIIIVKYNPYLESSASANRWRSLIEGLTKLHVEICIYIFGGYQSENEFKSINISEKYINISIIYITPRVLQGYWRKRYHTYIGERLNERCLMEQIIEEIRNKEGIVWTDSSLFSFRLAVYLNKLQPNRILFLELSEYLDIHKYNKGNFLQNCLGNARKKYFEEKAFYAYNVIALMTKTLYRYCESFPEPLPQLLHLPMTVDLDRFSKKLELLPNYQQPYIVFVGVMVDAKDGVSLLIRAYKMISKEFPKHKLFLIGGWNYDTPIHQKLIEELQLEGRVIWQGELNRDYIPPILKNAELLVLPRPDSKQAMGGFPTKLGEYLATGNPVCATKVGEIPDYLVDGESIYFAEPGSVESFAKAMYRALINPTEAKKIGENGRLVAEKHFNKDIQARILVDCFDSMKMS